MACKPTIYLNQSIDHSDNMKTFEFILNNHFVTFATQFKNQEGNYQIMQPVEKCFGRRLKTLYSKYVLVLFKDF